MKNYQSVEEYLEQISSEELKAYKRIKEIVIEIIPEAEEVISFGIPTFKYKERVLLHFGVFKNHISIFPGSALTEEIRQQLDDFKFPKDTIQFTADKPIPEQVIRELLRVRY